MRKAQFRLLFNHPEYSTNWNKTKNTVTLTIPVLQPCCVATTEYGITSDFAESMRTKKDAANRRNKIVSNKTTCLILDPCIE